MGWFVKFMIFIGIGLTFSLYTFEFSDMQKAVLISLIGGIIVFVLFASISALTYPKYDKKDKQMKEDRIKRKTKTYLIGLVIMIISMLIFINSYLYFQALLGNDLLVSLNSDKENLNLINGEEDIFNIKAKILINPFCQANCSINLKDLSENKIVYSENVYLRFSSPFLKEYTINSHEETSGQKLYQINLECNTIRERLCYAASYEPKSRTKIISVNYELNEIQKEKKQELKNQTEELNRNLYEIQDNLNKIQLDFYFLDLSVYKNKTSSLNETASSLLPEILNLNNMYENQEYSEMPSEISLAKNRIENLSNKFNDLNFSVYYTVNLYNRIIDNLSIMHDEILYLQNHNFSNSSVILAENFIKNFNSAAESMKENTTAEEKYNLLNKLKEEKENLTAILENESTSEIPRNKNTNLLISAIDLPKLNPFQIYSKSNFSLSEPPPICCLRNECYKCINESSKNYPVLLVHGHSFNEKLSAEISLESFNDLSKELEKEGYVNAGDLYGINYDPSSKETLGKINNSIVMKATYYVDILNTEEGSFILDAKWDNIDTYAERLNEMVYNLKYMTGKDKVIIVAHSMGGLVTRRYIQLYGSDNIDRIILVGTPNKGIDGFVLNYCAVFGADIECSEMNKDSSFMTELSSAPLPDIPFYNLVGLGCFWENSPGDGIVKNSSAYLEGAENIFVTGACRRVDFFHVEMIKPDKYPEIYSIIKDKLRN